MYSSILSVFKVLRVAQPLMELLLCVCIWGGPGGDVRLLLHGALHGKLLHHTGSGLPEIHEQPGRVQDLIMTGIMNKG